jgi:hypothetical protein
MKIPNYKTAFTSLGIHLGTHKFSGLKLENISRGDTWQVETSILEGCIQRPVPPRFPLTEDEITVHNYKTQEAKTSLLCAQKWSLKLSPPAARGNELMT